MKLFLQKNPQELLPGLGSLKPDSSQRTVSLLPPLDDTKLKDPKYFFEAHDRHENSRQDIQKQIGGNMSDSDPADTYRYPRPRERRPDLGRKMARFSLKPDSIPYLATVIGMKYVSPTKCDDGTSTLKVKSFVSDEYTELVELAALH